MHRKPKGLSKRAIRRSGEGIIIDLGILDTLDTGYTLPHFSEDTVNYAEESAEYHQFPSESLRSNFWLSAPGIIRVSVSQLRVWKPRRGKKQWEFLKTALSNGVEKKKEQNEAGSEELWLQHGPSHTESRTARFQCYQGCATRLPFFICMGKKQHRKEAARYLQDTAVSVVLWDCAHLCKRFQHEILLWLSRTATFTRSITVFLGFLGCLL